MKRKISLLIAFLLVFSMVGCGTKEDNTTVGSKGSTTNVNSETEGTDNTSADTSLQYIQNKGKFVLGLDDSFPPMGFRDDNDQIVGFDIDLAQAVCDKLGIELVVQPISWDAKEQELSTKSIDCIWNGLSITDERKENMTMSEAYLENTIALIVRADSGITTLDDVAGKSVAIQGGSAAEETLDSTPDFKDSLGKVNVFDDYVTALMDLETGASDAVLMDSVVANYMINENNKNFVILDEYLQADYYGIGFRKGEQALCDAVSNALSELKAEGKIADISTKWFGSDITLIK